jgi:hypothetical protein
MPLKLSAASIKTSHQLFYRRLLLSKDAGFENPGPCIINSDAMKNAVLLFTLLLVICLSSACAPSILRGQTARNSNQGTTRPQTSTANVSRALASGDNSRHDFTRLGRAGIVGLIKEGENRAGVVRFNPSGSDVWVDIPSDMIDQKDQLGRLVGDDGQAYQRVRLQLVGQQERLRRLLGIWGWNEIQDNTTLVGVVESNDYSGGIGGDGDWLLKIRPDPGFEALLVNRSGVRNADGLIECEIEPLDAIGNEENANSYFGRLRGKRVIMLGTWVEDKSHDNKTEIHPITSISCVDGDFMHLFVFSDDSDNFPADVPHSKENRTAHFSLRINPVFTTFSISEERTFVRSRSVGVVADPPGKLLVATVESGTPDEGKGFYYIKLKLERCPPQGCEQPVPPHGHYLEIQFFDGTDSSGGSMFLQNGNGSFRETPLAANLSKEELAQVAARLAEELGMRYVLRGDTIKLYAPRPWPRIVCNPGVFNYSEGDD